MDNNELKKLYQAVNILRESSDHKAVKDIIKSLRDMIKANIKVDPIDSLGITFWGEKKPFFMEGTMYYRRCQIFNKDNYWVDNWLEAMRAQNSNLLKEKCNYFRDGNDFYRRDQYFKAKDGKIYSKSEYRERDGVAYSLKQSFELPVFYKERGRSYYDTELKQYTIICNKDEEFADFKGRFRLWPVNHPSYSLNWDEYGLTGIDDEFFMSMFKVGNKRIRDNVLTLSKEDIAQLEFSPTESHKQVLRDILQDYKDYPNVEEFVNKILEYIRKGCDFYVRVYEDWRYRKQIKKKIINNLCSRTYNAYQAIKVLKFLSNIEED